MYANTDMKMMPGQYREIGQTLGPDIPVQLPPVAMALDQLEKELHYLRESIHQLEQRLLPVMRPVPESLGKEQIQGCGGGSPLVSQLDSYCRIARVASANVRALIDCLEL